MRRKDRLQELRSITREELLQKEKALKEELAKLNLQRYSGRVDKPHMFLSIKKDIARIRTILSPVTNTRVPAGKSKISDGLNGKKVQA